MPTLELEIGEEALAALRRLSPEGEPEALLRLAAAAKLYELGRVSQEVAAQIGGLRRSEFLLALARFEVSPFQDTRASLAAEMNIISEARPAPTVADLPTPPGLCAACVHRRLVASKRSVFLLCALSETDPRFPRYPPLPVGVCAGYRRSREDLD